VRQLLRWNDFNIFFNHCKGIHRSNACGLPQNRYNTDAFAASAAEVTVIVGVPKEVKRDEYRVAMLPVGVEEFTRAGHQVLVEHEAGIGSGLPDSLYADAGAELVERAADVFVRADLIVKVKEPQPDELAVIRPGQVLFTYFHFAADRKLTEGFLATGATAVAYETLRDDAGRLPLLTPMSEVAGRMSIQEGAKYLEKPQMGRGILLGGVPGVAPANITILGGGVVGANAAKVAAGFGANIGLLDVNMDRLRYLDDVTPANVDVLFSDRHTIRDQLSRADLVIGAVLIPGAKAPRLIQREDLKHMKPGSVIIDVAIDQGGCVETSRPTTHSEPTYIVDDVLHYCVTNMPGAVGRTSTYALCNVTLPWALAIANVGIEKAAAESRPIARAINIAAGEVTNRPVAETFGIRYSPRFAAAG
jgi:alanine dehydrogenase